MGIKFANGGFLTTIQDAGRVGFQESGVPVTGVMDTRSYKLANILVGNDDTQAVLEVTLMGPMLQFTSDNIIAVTGGDLGPKLNGKDLTMYQAVPVKQGDSLSFMGIKSGSRAYVAFAGGLDIPLIMGSRSTHLKSNLGGYKGRKLGAGDEIEFLEPKTTLPNLAGRKVEKEDFTSTGCELHVVMGPQDDCFTDKGIKTFLGGEYALTNEADRMGLRFEGEVVEHKDGGDIITDGISFGAVQIPSHGQPIVMMADHQTTGGYTKIASVVSVDLPRVAQLKPGCKVHFKKISIEEAQALYVKELGDMAALREGLDKVEVKIPAKEKEAVAMAVATAAAAKGPYMVKKKYKVTIDGEDFEVELESEVQVLP